MRIVCTLVLIFPGFQPSQPSHPPVPNRFVNTLFRILKDNKEYKRTRKDHLSIHGRVTGGLREGWWKNLEALFGATCMRTCCTCCVYQRSYGISSRKQHFSDYPVCARAARAVYMNVHIVLVTKTPLFDDVHIYSRGVSQKIS